MMLSRLDEEKDGTEHGQDRNSRGSLKDRFKLLRIRGETGISSPLGDDEALNDITTPTTVNGTGNEGAGGDLPPVPQPDGSLAPGTMSGVNAGLSTMPETEVDWDLWQSVVYEGPAAVARTSADELNKAIATGIPNAIRGVIWQVLAQSKNSTLEATYKDLLGKGTDTEKARHSNSTTTSSALSTQSGDVVNSSASSVHSNLSGGPNEKGTDAGTKQHPVSLEDRKRKEKEDAASLQKLEKTIRRDLGARTSFSKYAAAQGLQEGLFGVCKAYALYDEGVGYAQGMNFLIMPLLFNVSGPTFRDARYRFR